MSRIRDLLDFFKQEQQAGRRVFRHGDPAIGLEYNKINPSYRVSRNLWKVDIARTPQVVRELSEYVNVHGEAWVANSHSSMVNYKASKCRGRGRF